MVRTAEVEHREVCDAQTQVEVHGLHATRPARRVVTNAAHHIHFTGHEHARTVVGNEQAVRVVQGVAGKTAHAQQRSLGLGMFTHGADIHLTEAIYLHRAYERMATPVPQQVEGTQIRHPAFHLHLVVATRTDWYRLGDENAFGVRHHQVLVESELSEARCQTRHQANASGKNFAIVTPGFGTGNDAQFSERVVRSSGSHRRSFGNAAFSFKTPAAKDRPTGRSHRKRGYSCRGLAGRRSERGSPPSLPAWRQRCSPPSASRRYHGTVRWR